MTPLMIRLENWTLQWNQSKNDCAFFQPNEGDASLPKKRESVASS